MDLQALIIQNASFVVQLLGGMATIILVGLGFLGRFIFIRVFRAPEKYVTHDQLGVAIRGAIDALTTEIKTLRSSIEQTSGRLEAGDLCFDDFERSFRTILLTLYRLCRAWEAKFGENLDCEHLHDLIRDLHNGQ